MAFTTPDYQTFYTQANDKLAAYYTRILAEEQGDVERAKRRIDEDYTRGVRIPTEDYVRNVAFAQETAGAARKEEDVGRKYDVAAYQQALQQDQMVGDEEGKALETNLAQRGLSLGGLRDKKFEELSKQQGLRKEGINTGFNSEQDRRSLRREAIDRALKKSEEDLKFQKERGLEEETIKQRRGTEDVATGWAKFQTEKTQERGDKALGLAEQTYNREFGKRSTEESFRLQNESLALARG